MHKNNSSGGDHATKASLAWSGSRAARRRIDLRRRAGAGGAYRRKAAAEFLASVTLGNSEAIEYPLKTLPRPKGRSTYVVITEYDLPRK